MKTTIITFCTAIFLLFATTLQAQHAEGDLNINVGFGLVPVFGTGGFDFPPVNVSGEYGITDEISAGAFLSYAQSSEDFIFITTDGKWKYTYVIIGARGSYHFHELIEDLPENIDLYAGVMGGFYTSSVKWSGTGVVDSRSNSTSILVNVHAGGRYRFTENIGVYLEVGYGFAVINAGLNILLSGLGG